MSNTTEHDAACTTHDDAADNAGTADSREPSSTRKVKGQPQPKQAASRRQASASSRREAADDEGGEGEPAVVRNINHYVEQHCSGVPPIYAEGVFFRYDARVWRSISEDALKQWLFTNLFQRKAKLQVVREMVDYMKMLFRQERFPDPISLRLPPPGQPRVFRIALNNCTIDPMSGEVVADDPENFLRTQLDFDYDPEAECPRFDQFCKEIFAPDTDQEDKIIFLMQMMGYLLVPVVHHEAMFWLIGGGSNGKSVLLQVLRWLLGSENVANLSIAKLGDRFSVVQLVGKLANFDDDMRIGKAVQDEYIKKVTSGNPISAEQKGQPVFSFTPYARLVTAANRMPMTKDTTDGFFRRMSILTFNRKFTEKERDRHLLEKLRAELPGIFNVALGGLQHLESEGSFIALASSSTAVATCRKEANPVQMFLEEKTEVLPGRRTLTGELYEVYKRFCNRDGYRPLTNAQFGIEMSQAGYEVIKSNGRRYYPVVLKLDDIIDDDSWQGDSAEDRAARRRNKLASAPEFE